MPRAPPDPGGELKDSEAGAPRAPVGENTDLSLINCDSASLAIARRNFSISSGFRLFTAPVAAAKLARSADLSGNLTVDRPQKIRRLGSPSGDDTRKFSLSLALIEWTAMRLISLISASRWIGGLALDQ